MRAAHADYLPRDRHPRVALFVTLPPREVDVNVHPAKAEVRFRNAGLVRALIVHALKTALAREGMRAATTGGAATIAAFRPQGSGSSRHWSRPNDPRRAFAPLHAAAFGGGFAEAAQAVFDVGAPVADIRGDLRAGFAEANEAAADLVDHPLGAARAQVHDTYIVAQTRDGLVIVDQHAAHERIVYERLKATIDKSGVARQILLIPEVVELDRGRRRAKARRAAPMSSRARLEKLVLEAFGSGCGGASARRAGAPRRDRRRRRIWCAILPST